MAPRLILASNSIRRYDLLGQVGIVPDIVDPSNVDETIYDQSLPPHQIALMLARKKAHSISENEQYKNDFILAADTVVAIGRTIMEKTEDIKKAREILNSLSGRNHRVFTAVCVRDQKGFFYSRNVETRVKFKTLSESEIHHYLNTGEWRGKAGAYAIQGFAGGFVARLIGSYSSVVGLPLYETLNLLIGIGFNAQNKPKNK
ncbi:Maf family nucleotide pyrophosphatase [Gammaproteobacteria bacterium]|nr:Maf family nucleotide pyrophosphatase [Gammaproteobacteria bacterium]